MKDRSGRVVLKFALVVINLIFFATQLSYKFYACANVPVRQSSEVKAKKTPDLARDALMHGSADSKFLSLDKRYDSKHIFALLPLFPCIDPLPELNIEGLPEYQELLFSHPILIPSQRGPPVV
jgi:hypothetical protein